jgi:hypothetical protein
MFTPHHFGLFFTPAHVQAAQRHARHEPFANAFTLLREQLPSGDAAAAQWAGLRYRFLDDADQGTLALAALDHALSFSYDDTMPYLDALKETIVYAHTFEMVRDHPAEREVFNVRWRDWFYERVATLNEHLSDKHYHEHLWLALLNLCAGIVLEREPVFMRGVEVLKQVVAGDISPRGHIDQVVKAPGSGTIMARSVQAVTALTLMAEAAAHVGVNLWEYQVRGVSVTTAAIYPMYYFYVTEKWQWEDITPEEVQAVYRAHGGYLEILHHRLRHKDFKPLLADLRPLYDPYAGGLTTLTHGIVVKRGLFGMG